MKHIDIGAFVEISKVVGALSILVVAAAIIVGNPIAACVIPIALFIVAYGLCGLVALMEMLGWDNL